MADTKISALTTDAAPHRTNDFAPTYDASAVATKKVALKDFGVITYMAGFSNATLTDATTYYFGWLLAAYAPATTANARRIYVQRAGIITGARITWLYGGSLGSSETFTTSIRLNNSSDTTISSACTMDGTVTFVTTSLTLAVAVGDYFEIKMVTPTWVANPGAMYGQVQVLQE